MPSGDEPEPYSKAFSVFVSDEADLTGLLAYALYKQSINEAAAAGREVTPPTRRQPTRTETQTYRNAAESRLSLFVESAIEQSRVEIAETALRSDFAQMRVDLTAVINRATAWRTAVTTNLVAWLLSIAITFLVVVAGVPGWIASLATQPKP